MWLLVNHQLIPIPIQSKSISLEQMLLKISVSCRNFIVLSSFFDVKKQRPTMNLEKCYQCSVNIEISLDLKVYFSLVTCKINNSIALCSTNQINEISALWWLLIQLTFSVKNPLFFCWYKIVSTSGRPLFNKTNANNIRLTEGWLSIMDKFF